MAGAGGGGVGGGGGVLPDEYEAPALGAFRGPLLLRVIQHVARTHPRPVEAGEGRGGGNYPPPPPGAPERSLDAALNTPVPRRPHPAPCGCEACREWAAAVVPGRCEAFAAARAPRRAAPARPGSWRSGAIVSDTPLAP